MEILTLRRIGESAPIFDRVQHARSWWQRLRGLIGRTPLRPGSGLLITPCNSVHTFGMRYPLDLVFLDRQGKVVKCVETIKPNRMVGARYARHTLELAPGSILAKNIRVGDTLSWH